MNAKVISDNELEHNILGIIKGKFVRKFKKGDIVKLLVQPEDFIISQHHKM